MNDRDRKILEFSGFRKMTWPNGNFQWHTPNYKPCDPPILDLNFLAEYVFPKLAKGNVISIDNNGEEYCWYCAITQNGESFITSKVFKDKSLLEACLQAVEQAIGKE